MTRSIDDTIAAIATAPGAGGIGIVRVSGPLAGAVGHALLVDSRKNPVTLAPRYATICRVADRGGFLDEVLALWFPGPNSYTREDLLEIHTHGGRAAGSAVLDAVLSLEGLRLAGPGEFTLRAYLKGRIDLVQAEAVADSINALTTETLRVHEALLGGALSLVVAHWQSQILKARATIEVLLDFPEDAGEDEKPLAATALLGGVRDSMRSRLASYSWGRTARDGFTVAIVGEPNVGKSSLLNRLAESERAIVSPHAGTTRDTIEVEVNVLGARVRFIDTAGLRESDDPVEGEGVARALSAAAKADLVLRVVDCSVPVPALDSDFAEALTVVNKIDLAQVEGIRLHGGGKTVYPVSAKTGEGVEPLLLAIREVAFSGRGSEDVDALTRLRHRDCVQRSLEAVEAALGALDSNRTLDLAGSELNHAMEPLRELLGWGATDDVLDRIFAEFCIGK